MGAIASDLRGGIDTLLAVMMVFYDGFNEPGLTYSRELVEWFQQREIPNLVTDTIANEVTADPVPVTTLAGAGGTTTLTTTADAKVDGSLPTTNYAAVALRVDASPDVRSYVKFDASGVTGTVQSATLRIWATSAQSTGFDVYAVGDSTWAENAITYANQPSASISPASASASFSCGAGSRSCSTRPAAGRRWRRSACRPRPSSWCSRSG